MARGLWMTFCIAAEAVVACRCPSAISASASPGLPTCTVRTWSLSLSFRGSGSCLHPSIPAYGHGGNSSD